jgi:2-polyprenyl-6-methoxyphenol hydroxylase-like FAD-dependent oxidoreductase
VTRVLIAGGGLGGLTLAHGLRQSGLDVAVFERDHPHATQLVTSYRIHIDSTGSQALHACVPPDVWQRFTERSAAPPRGLAFVTERLQRLTFIGDADPRTDPVAHAHPISRAGLRQLLYNGLEDIVAFDKRLVRYEEAANGQVRASFADGSSASGDVLVGADGSTSAVRKQLLPHARVVDTGVAGVAGKLYLTDSIRERLPREFLSQMTMVLPMREMSMFMASFQRRSKMHSADQLDLPDHLFWVINGRASRLGLTSETRHRSAEEFMHLALRQVNNWHPLLRWIVAESDPRSLVGVPLHSAQPVAPWPSTHVTLLGDAIHTMTPLQGLGGNTALRDAATLRHHLVQADRGRRDLVDAIHAYESAMLEYGFDAAKRSLEVSNAVASTNVPSRLAFRAALRIADRLPWLHRRMFNRPTLDLPAEHLATAIA